jgi:hypothetical protein
MDDSIVRSSVGRTSYDEVEFGALETSEDQALAKSGADNSKSFEGRERSFRSAMA